jgi:hypothetical protein
MLVCRAKKKTDGSVPIHERGTDLLEPPETAAYGDISFVLHPAKLASRMVWNAAVIAK